MNLLGIDTSTEVISISFCVEDKVVVNFNRRVPASASKVLVYLDKLLKKSSYRLQDFQAFVVGIGPGSFTGLRVACSIIKAFSIALGIPIIAIGSFYSLANRFKNRYKKLAVISDAKRNLVYAATFIVKENKIKKEEREGLYTLKDFLKGREDYLFLTNSESLRKEIKKINPFVSVHPKDVWPQAKELVGLAKQYYQQRRFTPLDKLEPLYIYPKECQIKNV